VPAHAAPQALGLPLDSKALLLAEQQISNYEAVPKETLFSERIFPFCNTGFFPATFGGNALLLPPNVPRVTPKEYENRTH
jgi:hypothetical protein